MVAQDVNNPKDNMGFFATLVTCTLALAGGALLPIVRDRTDTVATVLMIAFAVLSSVLLGGFYVPAAIAMALVRVATHANSERVGLAV